MPWKKSSPSLIAVFDAVLPAGIAERRQMFGYPCAFVGGNLCFPDFLRSPLWSGLRRKTVWR